MNEIMNGIFNTPFFIFIKTEEKLNDQEIMDYLGLEDYKFTAYRSYAKKYHSMFFITEMGEWSCVMDEWNYYLYHQKHIRKNIEFLSRKFDVFYCALPDSDDSYEYVIYKNKNLIRKVIAVDPNYKGAEIKVNLGTPFPVEKNISLPKRSFEAVSLLASELGVKVKFEIEKIRCYEKRNKN